MQPEIQVWAYDILNAIIEIEAFLGDEYSFAGFRHDLKTRRAVERNLEIIGEAMKRILQLDPNLPLKDARKIVDTRNRIIHGYDTVSEEVIWGIVTTSLPVLKQELEILLQEQ
jgi:uncharacterized protein with HEPN domain